MKNRIQTTGKTVSRKAIEEARVARWRRHIVERLAKLPQLKAFAIPQSAIAAIENIEGKNIVDVILEKMRFERGITSKSAPGAASLRYSINRMNRETDDWYEGEPTKSRNRHEKDETARAVDELLLPVYVPTLSCDDWPLFVKYFYKPHDWGFTEATIRAVNWAIESKATADNSMHP